MAAYAAHAIALGEQDPWVSKFIYQVSDTQNELFPWLMLTVTFRLLLTFANSLDPDQD